MARQRRAKKADKGEPAEAPAAEANGQTEARLSKMEAVRRALAEGVDKPQDGVAFVRDRFGLELSAMMFSSYKSSIQKKAGGASGGKPGRGEAKAADSGSIVEAVADLKRLVDRHGAATVRGLVDVLGR